MIRRILVAIDASPDSLAAAEAAAEMAALLSAELHGLFVEDVELLRLVASPLARELDLLTAASRDAESAAFERQLRAHARMARETLGTLADRLRIKSSFQVARGAVAEEILAAATEADLVTLGRVGWTVRRRRDLGKTARALISRGGRRLLLLERSVTVELSSRRSRRIIVLFDASDAGRDALDLANHLARQRREPRRAGGAQTPTSRAGGAQTQEIRVLLVGDDPEGLSAAAAGILGADAETSWLGRLGPEALADAVSRLIGGVVIVPVAGPDLGEDHLRALLEAVACPVLAVS